MYCAVTISIKYVRTYSGVSRVRVPPEQLFFSKEITLLRLVALAFFET